MYLKTATNIPLDKALERTDAGLEEAGQGCLVKYGMTRDIGICSVYHYPDKANEYKAARYATVFSFSNFFPCVISGNGDTDDFRSKARKRFRGLHAAIIITPLTNSSDLAEIRFPVKPVRDGIYYRVTDAFYREFNKAINQSPSINGTIGIKYLEDEESFCKWLSRAGRMPVLEIAVGSKFLEGHGWCDLNSALLNALREITAIFTTNEDKDEDENN